MRKLLKNIFPAHWQHHYRKWRYSIADHENPTTNLQEKFTHIFTTNYWQGEQSVSGKGSDITQTQTLIEEVEKLLKTYQIKTVLDIPCGDFYWMQKVDLTTVHYVGADIVEPLIAKNKERYSREGKNIDFQVLDITQDTLPKVDLILCRDCFIHLSYAHIQQALKNIQQSNSTYLLATTYTNYSLNYNVPSTSWRPLNLQKSPFNFPIPIAVINENCTEDGGRYQDKSMALWKIEDISI